MSVRQTIKRHYKIISLLRLRAMSYEEVQEEMNMDPDSREENLMTSQRTFQRDILDIASIYGIEIESDRSQSKYYIKDDLEETHSQRLRENFEILNAIRLSKSLGNSLVFEERRSLGTQNMAGLLHAIQNSLKVKFDYHKFYDDTDSKREVMPIALKEARNRWYLIAKDVDNIIKNFALDRIVSLMITEIKFKPISYNVNQEFKDTFGIINGTNEKPVNVLLSFTPREGRYIESLPLHRSQKLISKDDKEYLFTYFIRPTYDFKMELLSYGDQVKVFEPKILQKEIREQLQSALNSY
ncbi:putative DNA-binding transcriptional regulator YafY [Gillisia mitskevichiae]|uniref:Putative DNA-binding transcriptional regulator YafY n=1 Tax=Gillisia mitskevichiae TaxID=270921 RepID=A0A495PU88_9FLAO|nr:WYL domain-containing protein [Gillisia mitskevichiae]RKS53787.1 putative DNA-binding transcriptional regulator YafY [Gillisia mitskevichiae]